MSVFHYYNNYCHIPSFASTDYLKFQARDISLVTNMEQISAFYMHFIRVMYITM